MNAPRCHVRDMVRAHDKTRELQRPLAGLEAEVAPQMA